MGVNLSVDQNLTIIRRVDLPADSEVKALDELGALASIELLGRFVLTEHPKDQATKSAFASFGDGAANQRLAYSETLALGKDVEGEHEPVVGERLILLHIRDRVSNHLTLDKRNESVSTISFDAFNLGLRRFFEAKIPEEFGVDDGGVGISPGGNLDIRNASCIVYRSETNDERHLCTV